MTIHIPDEVIEAAAKALYEHDATEDWIPPYDEVSENYRLSARAAITAALEAWPATGMAKDGRGYTYNIPEVEPGQWEAYTNPNYEMTDDPSFPVIMIRTEAP